jgi:putative ABC transport system substrate-binding protein
MLDNGRREFVTLLGGAAAVWPLAARAQQGERVRRIGVLHGLARDDAEAPLRVSAIEQGLRERGWTQGRNITIEYRWAGAASEAQEHAKALVDSTPDLIVAHSSPVLAALSRETSSIPIVFVVVIDPVGGGYVRSLARPGGNITGFTNYEMTIGGKWLEILKELSPTMKRVALLFNPDTAPFSTFFQQSLTQAASSFAVDSTALVVRDATEIENAMPAFAAGTSAGLIVVPDVTTVRHRHLIISLAARHRLPAIYPFRYFAGDGGLVYYGMDVIEHYRGAAAYIDRILRGADPADLPVQAPTQFELIINLKAAQAIGVEVPALLLARADEVIE